MTPFVSYAVAVYNVADYIEKCARSLFEQTLENIEIVFVSDASPDDSVDIIRRTLEEYPQLKDQVKIIVHEHNMGLHQVRKTGFEATTGKYVMFVDGDDYVDIHSAETVYKRMEEQQDDLLFFDYYVCNDSGCYLREIYQHDVFGDGENLRLDSLNMRFFLSLWTRAFRRTLLIDNDVVWPVSGMSEDTVVGGMMAFYSEKTDYIHAPLYYYQQTQGSYLRTKGEAATLKRYNEYQLNVTVYQDFLIRKGADEKYALGLFIRKLSVRNYLRPLMNQRKYQLLWLHTYPEINKTLFWGSSYFKSTYREKIWVICIALGLYPFFQRRLMSRHFKLDRYAY